MRWYGWLALGMAVYPMLTGSVVSVRIGKKETDDMTASLLWLNLIWMLWYSAWR